MVNRQVKFLQGAPKVCSSVIFWYFSHPNAKRPKTKAFLEVSLVSLTLRARTVFQNCWKYEGNFTVLVPRRQKFDLFYPKFGAELNDLTLMSKSKRPTDA